MTGSPGPLLLSAAQLQARVAELGADIARELAGGDLVLVAALKAGVPFFADLSRAIDLPLALDTIELEPFAAAAPGAAAGQGRARVLKDVDLDLAGRDVVLVDCIVDTGLTLACILRHLAGLAPRSLAAVVMLDRPYRRLVADLPLRHVGFVAPDVPLAGYGLGDGGRLHHLPGVHVRSDI